MGSLKFLGLVGELLLLSHVATVGLAAAAAKALPDLAGHQYYGSCAVGFSAVLFALKVVLSHRTPGWSFVGGIALPTKVNKSTSWGYSGRYEPGQSCSQLQGASSMQNQGARAVRNLHNAAAYNRSWHRLVLCIGACY